LEVGLFEVWCLVGKVKKIECDEERKIALTRPEEVFLLLQSIEPIE